MALLSPPVRPQDRRFGPRKKTQPDSFLRDHTGARYFRVLVADVQEAHRQRTIEQLWAAWPFQQKLVVEVAADGTEALDKIRRQAYAFVVLDWNLPRPDGVNLLHEIRAQGRRVPIIVVAAQRRAAIATDLESLGAAFANKSELDPTRFRNAMAAAILLQQAMFGMAPTHTAAAGNGSAHARPGSNAEYSPRA